MLEHQQKLSIRAAIRDMSDLTIHRLLEGGSFVGDILRAELAVEQVYRKARLR
jgi:hypothetical protein